MKKTRRQVVNLGVGSLVSTGALGAGLADARAQTETPTPASGMTASDTAAQTTVLRPEIDPIAAQETALEGHPGASVRALALESDNGLLHYEVELSNGAEVTIDATTGQIMEPGQSQSSGAENENGEDDDEDSEEDEDEENGGRKYRHRKHRGGAHRNDSGDDDAD